MGEFLACFLIFMTFFFNLLFWFGSWDAIATVLMKLHPKLDLRVLKTGTIP